MNEYQQQLLDHYRLPQNYGKPDFAATHSYTLENKSCGDKITIYLNVCKDVVKDVSFEGEGCSIAVGSASLLYSTLKGKHVKDINLIKIDDVLELVGIDLTSARLKCANLPLEVLKTAVTSF